MTRRLLCLLLILCSACVVFFAPAVARADDPNRVVVPAFSGDEAEAIRDAVLRGLADHDEITLVSSEFARNMGEGLGASIDSAGGVKKVSSVLGLAAVVAGEVKSGKDGWTATIKVKNSQGDVTETHKFRADGKGALASKVEKIIWKQIGPALKDASPPKGSSKKKVVIMPFDGSSSKTVRGYVVGAMKKDKNTEVVSDKTVDGMGLDLKGDVSADALREAGTQLDAALFVAGKVEKKGGYTLEVKARNAADGEMLSEFSLKGRNLFGLRAAINKDLRKKLAASVERAKTPAPPAETIPGAADADEGEGDEGAAGEEEEEEEEEDDGEPSPKPGALEIGAGIRAFSRNYRYTDDLFDALRSYKLGAAPAGFVWLRWYPAAHFTGGVPANIGLTGGYEQGFAVKSQVSGGEELDTKTSEWWAGLRYRFPIDSHEVGIVGTYGSHKFEIDDDPANPLVPDTNYTYIRLGIDGRVRVSKILIGAHLGHRFLLDTGELQSDEWFPNAGGGAVDAGFFVGYELFSGLALEAGFDFRRYYLSFDPEPGDPRVAGGAVDEYLSGWFGFAYRMPGD